MIILKKKQLTAVILLLIMTFAAMASASFAQTVPTANIKNKALLSLEPSKVGVGQTVVIIYGITHVNPLATATGPFFEGFTLTTTFPDGTTKTDSVTVDSTSFGHTTLTPSMVGTYDFQLSFAGQWVNITAGMITGFGPAPTSVNNYYEPDTTPKMSLTVQQESVPGIPTIPPSTSYWTTPVYSENKNWGSTIDNWLMQAYSSQPRFFNGLAAFSPYTTGPNSPHILWTTQLQEGGLAGAMFPGKSLYASEVYQQYYIPLIVNGKIYYVDHGPTNTGGQGGTGSNRIDNFGTRCIDLYTGQEVFYLTNVTIDMAQTLDVETPNKHGVVPYLWSIPGLATYAAVPAPPATGLAWEMYDAFTGNKILTIQNATGGFPIFGPMGEILLYTLDYNGKWMSLWNSTKCIDVASAPLFFSPSRDTVVDWSGGLEWNVTLNAPNGIGAPAIQAISPKDNIVLVLYGNILFYPTDQTTYPAVLTACAYPATMTAGTTAVNPVWVQKRTNIYDFVETHFNINEGMYSFYDDLEQKVHTYDISNGNEISVSLPLSEGNLYTTIAHTWMAYGNTYVWSYDGHVRCVEGKTGNILWDTSMGDLPYGQAYSVPPLMSGPTIADGKLYIGGNDHSPDSNMWVGGNLWCLDAFNGKILWNISGYYTYNSLSNGYLTTYNGYDVKIYTYGKGPSATTVTAPTTEVAKGAAVLLQGTVTDQSPGAKQLVQTGKFNVVPAMSDASNGAWMEYLYMQQPKPTNAVGVSVHLTAIDPNGNFQDIGTAKSDLLGNYVVKWTPPVSGLYTVTASFEGSNSYYGSEAGTSFVVSETPAASIVLPSPSVAPQPTSGIPTTTYIVIAAAVVTIAVLAAALVLRRRK
jgi:outer membrane protein assembly factor BamB